MGTASATISSIIVAAGYELLFTDVNATGIDGAPLPLAEIELNLDLTYTAGVAQELRTPVPTDFTIVASARMAPRPAGCGPRCRRARRSISTTGVCSAWSTPRRFRHSL